MKDILSAITKYREQRGWTETQKKLLTYWARLNTEQQEAVLSLIEKI